MKLYQFTSNNECSIIKVDDPETVANLKAMGYFETSEEAKQSRINDLNKRIDNIVINHKREISELSTQINFIYTF